MTQAPNKPNVAAVLAGLKDFQRITVQYVFDRLYGPDATGRFLVADEVGLGKTLVARGVIAKAIDHLWKTVDRIDIVYICSNGEIARQNINRLNVFPDAEVSLSTRLTLLPKQIKDLRDNKVNFVSFTPSTSFDLRSSMGKAEERVLLHDLLKRAWNTSGKGPLNVLQGWVKNTRHFRNLVRQHHRDVHLDRGIVQEFARRLKQHDRHQRERGEPTLRGRFTKLCEEFGRSRKHIPRDQRERQSVLIAELRALLAACCIESLEPDLIILDEFQRFKHLLKGEDEAGQLARHLFEWEETRVLLLSATPYKMYTVSGEHEEDHYADFIETLRFLLPSTNDVKACERLLRELRVGLYRLVGGGFDELQRVKSDIERLLRRVMCRTERLAVTADRSGMLRETPTPPMPLSPSDLRSYLRVQQLADVLDSGDMIEYWKSAPYLLNFMDGYAVKRKFEQRIDEPTLRDAMTASPSNDSVFLPWGQLRKYEQIDPANVQLRHFIKTTVDCGAWRWLWLPPTLPYYELSSPYDDLAARDFTKRLIFSCWQVVPKAVATLVSYEVERRVIRSFEQDAENTPEARKRRRPLLMFTRSKERLTGMPVLAMIYPSITLARIGDPLQPGMNDGRFPVDAGMLRERVRTKLAAGLEAITAVSPPGGAEDEAWHWVAPLLLDVHHHRDTTRSWWKRADLESVWSGAALDDPESRWSDHVAEARRVVEGETMVLGRPPADLIEVLCDLAIGGPANIALRALARVCGGAGALSASEIRDCAGRIGWSFRSLFNTPEATALIRGMNVAEPYWRRVLEYCVAGCLQSVMDEYAHVLRESLGLIDVGPIRTAEDLTAVITQVVGLRVATPNVDEIIVRESGLHIERQVVRARFAMRFGNDRTEDSNQELRSESVRQAFNSPFYPFVLVTTSVGQEGLDFHPYCHAVVHWNLPANPVDLEQREGRVHRYKGHAVRKNVAAAFGNQGGLDGQADPWCAMFEQAGNSAASDLELFWVYPGPAQIERHVPTLALSREWIRLPALRKSLALYRMVFGQPRQDDLVAYLLERPSAEQLQLDLSLLRIDLSPPAGN